MATLQRREAVTRALEGEDVMARYLRRAFRLGPLRVNLSKRGLGASAGVTGARVGVDASGTPYVHGGRGGLYDRRRGARIGCGAFVLAALVGLLFAWLR